MYLSLKMIPYIPKLSPSWDMIKSFFELLCNDMKLSHVKIIWLNYLRFQHQLFYKSTSDLWNQINIHSI